MLERCLKGREGVKKKKILFFFKDKRSEEIIDIIYA